MDNIIIGMNDWIQENPQKFFALIIGIAVVILVLLIIGGIVSRNKKKKALASGTKAELIFDADVYYAGLTLMDSGIFGYKIYAVNGNTSNPGINGRSLLVNAGQTTLDMQYIISGGKGLGHSTAYQRQTVTFPLKGGKQYKITYDVMDHVFGCTEK
ncbi:hypothetical protein LJC61_07220 [Ruminococcaceae bacterium OttesenSCG-928-A16]|nr:hypothetical protein [Ruminococcaceae bacterium OttesenSCG-928-A16]